MGSDQSKLERRLALEQIVSRMARNFVKLSHAEEGIQIALQEIGQFSGASRAYIFEFQSNLILMDNTFEWCHEDVSAEKENLQNIEVAMFPWWIEKLKSGNILNIHDVSELGSEAQMEKEILEMQNIKSVLVMPIMSRGELSGFVGFDNVHTVGTWQEDDQSVLSLAAELFSNVFERLLSEKELNDAKDELEASLNSLQTLQSQMIQQEHLVAIGQLAAGVAHEINNPLGFVLSNQKMLRQYTEKLVHYAKLCLITEHTVSLTDKEVDEITYINDDLEDLFDDVDMGLSRVKKIVESLRFFSRVDSLQMYEPYNVREGIMNTLVIIHNRITESVNLQLDVPDDLPIIRVFGSKMNQVLLNLITNALDAIVDRHPLSGGELKISAHVVSNEELKSFMKIQFIDNGIGMTDEVKQKIFNPFFTTKPVGKGTGLGMILVYDIVKNLHKGEIFIESEVNHGSTVTILIPMEAMV